MPRRYDFDINPLATLAGQTSVVDLPVLSFTNKDDHVDPFLKAYGFDLGLPGAVDKAWFYHRRAIAFLTERLGYTLEEIPEQLRERKPDFDFREIFVLASLRSEEQKQMQRWACAILRVMHVLVHSETDLYYSFGEEIQRQILSPIQSFIYTDGVRGITYLKSQTGVEEEIPLAGFEIKPLKTSSSTVIKLLAKPGAYAMSVYDKLGYRFVTEGIFDSFRVIRFLVEQGLVSYAQAMADQSSNNYYPVQLFLEECQKLAVRTQKLEDAELEEYLRARLQEKAQDYDLFRKQNLFSADELRFIKFISRAPVTISGGIQFYYPFEVQIIDRKTRDALLSGPAEHTQYKERQKEAARKRLFPFADKVQEQGN